MILNDKQILELAESKEMIVPFHDCQVRSVNEVPAVSFGLSSFGYDLRASNEWKIFNNVHAWTIIDPKNFNDKSFFTMFDDFCIIPPNSFALTHSVERLKMPHNITGICIGKSTYARCGIIVNVTPIEAGWEGYVTIEVSNTTPLPVKVYSNEGIAQLIFLKGELPEVTYADRNGKYMNQPKTVVLPKI